MTQFGDLENGYISLDDRSDEAFASIPDSRVSLATLRYIGYNEQTALQLWKRWTELSPSVFPILETEDDIGDLRFIEYATSYVRSRPDLHAIDAFDEDDEEWYRCMDACGIAEELQDAIMEPLYRDIRLTESCVFWILDTMRLRYLTLEAIQEASREREEALQRAHIALSPFILPRRPASTDEERREESDGGAGRFETAY